MVYEKYIKENYFTSKKQKNPNADLISCIIKTREDLIAANSNYEFADGDLIDYYLYQIKATQAKYNYLLKKAKKPVVLVCNKADKFEKQNNDIYEFYNLGIAEPNAISSVNASGIGDVLDAVYEYFPKTDETLEDDERIKVALIGKPNVGKSSLVNKILRRK